MFREVSTMHLFLSCLFAVGLSFQNVAPPGGESIKVEPLVRLLASDAAPNDNLGHSIAFDGGLIALGASTRSEPRQNSGVVYIFEGDGDHRWSRHTKLTVPDGQAWRLFGYAVALEGSTLVVGAPGNACRPPQTPGAVHVFQRIGFGIWERVASLVPNDARMCDEFGFSVALEDDTLVVGAHLADTGAANAGAVYVFTRGQDGMWRETGKLLPNAGLLAEGFGNDVAIDGNRLVVGADNFDAQVRRGGSAYVFERDPFGTWVLSAQLFPHDSRIHDFFGGFVDLEGNLIAVSADRQDGNGLPQTGAAYVFVRLGDGVWVEEVKLAPKTPAFFGFGRPSLEGSLLAVCSPIEDSHQGAVYLFRRTGREWAEVERIGPSVRSFRTFFGSSVVLWQGLLLVGAIGDDEAARSAGAVDVFTLHENGLRTR